MIAFVCQIYKRNDVIKFLNILDEFDFTSKSLDVKMNMKSARTWLIKVIILIACGVFLLILGTILTFELEVHYGAGYSMPLNYGYVLLYVNTLVLQFSFAALAIKSRFRLLNDNLRFTFLNL